jgi:hypothetical protein
MTAAKVRNYFDKAKEINKKNCHSVKTYKISPYLLLRHFCGKRRRN